MLNHSMTSSPQVKMRDAIKKKNDATNTENMPSNTDYMADSRRYIHSFLLNYNNN